MVCVAQYLTARFLPYNDMKEQFEFWLLFYLSAEAIPSNFLAFPLTDEFFFFLFIPFSSYLPASELSSYIPDIFNFCFLDKIPNNIFSGFVSFFICCPFYSLSSVL